MAEKKQPLAEVFGFRVDDFSQEADHYRQHRFCPYNNKVPACTKDKADSPLGVCSIYAHNDVTITCPVRFRQDWIILQDAAAFFFPAQTQWTYLPEVRLRDSQGNSAGNIDLVLVTYDDQGRVTDFGSLEVQAVYISGNVRRPFEYYMIDPFSRFDMDWSGERNYPRPDYLSSSRKRLAPQLLYKGGILKAWGKKQAVALHRAFFETLPDLHEVEPSRADLVWLVYDLNFDSSQNRFQLTRHRIVYTQFESALQQISTAEVGPVEIFVNTLQQKLAQKLLDER